MSATINSKQPGQASSANKSSVTLGTTIYSFTNEWLSRRYTLDQMVEKVAELEIGPGIEVVGFQSFRGFPTVTDEFAEHFRALLERLELTPTCLSGNMDTGIRPDRVMTVEEAVAYIEPQIEAAKKLGFPVLRIQALAGPEVMKRLAPAAEQAQVQVACELHSPLTPDNPEVIELRECYDRVGSPYLGFVPDFSCSMKQVPEGYWTNLGRAGAPEALIETAREIWHSDNPTGAKFGALAAAGGQYGADPGLMGSLNLAMTMFGHMPVDAWREILPYTRHIHGKFYAVDTSGSEPSIPYREIMELLKETGYRGSISAEWEGSMFNEEENVGFKEVQRWHAMVRQLLAQ